MNAEKTGKLISECRKEKQLTQLQLADLLHVSDKAVSRWETGKGFPDIGSLQSLGEVLDVSVTELLKGERSSLEKDELENEKTTLDLLELFKQTIRQKKDPKPADRFSVQCDLSDIASGASECANLY